MTHLPKADDGSLVVDFCGESNSVDPSATWTVGREADTTIDDNPFLHRVFLVFARHNGIWFVSNVGSQLSATVADADAHAEAFLGPGSSLPLVFNTTVISFTAGPTSYQLTVSDSSANYRAPTVSTLPVSATTVGPTSLPRDQRLLIVALAEPRLRGDGRASVVIPSSAAAAKRLGWTSTKFTRKLDNVCEKLSKLGVRGLLGDSSTHASNRRARLVEYAVATRLVTRSDLASLDDVDAVL
jgi:hypothetical protein